MEDEQKTLLAFGEIMRVLGQNARTLAKHPEYAKLVSDFLEKFVPKRDEDWIPEIPVVRCSECFESSMLTPGGENPLAKCGRCPKNLCKRCVCVMGDTTFCTSCCGKEYKDKRQCKECGAYFHLETGVTTTCKLCSKPVCSKCIVHTKHAILGSHDKVCNPCIDKANGL